ncbi:hypothetical protein BGZ76_004166 [Entomortierella beljakovae]|nr:hypothetical protein BGZ76_004166 [Entomortierella beljakovae]
MSTPSPVYNSQWPNTSSPAQHQDVLSYYANQGCLIPSTVIQQFDSISHHDQMHHSSSPSTYSASPSPTPFPPSPQQLSISPANLTSIPIDGPYPNPLDVNLFGEISIHASQYSYDNHPFNQNNTYHPSCEQNASHTSLQGNIGIQGTGVPILMQTSRNSDVTQTYQHHLEPRMTHWYLDNMTSHFPTVQPGSIEIYGEKQISAPSSPAAMPNMQAEFDSWLPTNQHRRSLSASHAYLMEPDRRYSEGDIMPLSPDFALFPDSTVPVPQSNNDYPNVSPTQPPTYDSFGVLQTNSTPGSPDFGNVSAPSRGSSPGAPGSYRCQYEGCNKRFSRPYNLNSHIKTHTNQRPYRCDHCERTFARLHDKNRHERLHRGERPYACEKCNHHFARMDALNRHLKVEGGRNLCNMYLIEKGSKSAHPIVEMPPKKINPLILQHFPNFGKSSSDNENDNKNQTSQSNQL